jgi:aspartokinase-like uncharacterized kinase
MPLNQAKQRTSAPSVFEAVVKLGGSLAKQPEVLRTLCKKLGEIAEKHRLLFIPGGGEFADAVRDIDQRYTISPSISHRMAILGMDQFGLFLSEMIPNSCTVYTLNNAKLAWKSKKTPIFLPSKLMFKKNPLPNSWDVTSDSIATYVASRLKAPKVVLVTDVDGIFTNDPKKSSNATLIKEISATDLFKSDKRNSVDRYLPKLLLETRLDCYIVNGEYPERTENILACQPTTCTLIKSDRDHDE